MRSYPAIALGIAVLISNGCAARPLDRDELPAAAQRESFANAQCAAKLQDKTINDARGLVECSLAAERQMVTDIKLQDMESFETYAAHARLLAAEVDAGQMSLDDGVGQYKAAQQEFMRTIIAAYQADDQKREEVRDFLHRLGHAIQQGSYAPRYGAPPLPPMCQSVLVGNVVNTTCY